MKKNGILAADLDMMVSTTRDRVTEALGANIFAIVQTLSGELVELELDPVTVQEFMIAVEGVLRGMQLRGAEEEEE